ncbi:MAG: hypothetical protein DYH17_00915 [Xanthomonadales bacterium PRO6]|nr:hypothetical protein [Xanthomonadales bacterium PRO6]
MRPFAYFASTNRRCDQRGNSWPRVAPREALRENAGKRPLPPPTLANLYPAVRGHAADRIKRGRL